MKNYEILKEKEICIIFSQSYINPIENIKEIEVELRSIGYSGDVYFDLLLKNGFTSNRYLKILFSGTFDSLNFFAIKEPKEDIVNTSLKYYQKNIKLLENSILSKREKFFIQKGKIVHN